MLLGDVVMCRSIGGYSYTSEPSTEILGLSPVQEGNRTRRILNAPVGVALDIRDA